MAKISYRRHRFPPVIIQHAVWLYLPLAWWFGSPAMYLPMVRKRI